MATAVTSLLLGGSALLAACSSASAPATPCPMGVCIGPPPGGGDASPGTDGGGSDSSGGGPCTPSWTCTAWSTSDGKTYTRTCTDANKCPGATPPVESAALPPLDKDYFACNVEPIFDRGCAFLGCHGTETGRLFQVYARGRLRNNENVPQVSTCPVGPQTVNLQQMGTGTIMCVGWSPHTATEWQKNYDNARSFMVGLSSAEVDSCDLLAQPVVGGKAHTGVHLFKDKNDPDYQTLAKWLSGATLGRTCDTLGN